jgi:hypothetical protein
MKIIKHKIVLKILCLLLIETFLIKLVFNSKLSLHNLLILIKIKIINGPVLINYF